MKKSYASIMAPIAKIKKSLDKYVDEMKAKRVELNDDMKYIEKELQHTSEEQGKAESTSSQISGIL